MAVSPGRKPGCGAELGVQPVSQGITPQSAEGEAAPRWSAPTLWALSACAAQLGAPCSRLLPDLSPPQHTSTPTLRKPPSACCTASGKLSVSEASFPYCRLVTIDPLASTGFCGIEMRRYIWTLPLMPYVSAASEPRALPWPESGWVQGEPESDPCLRASLERAVGARTSQQIGEGKSSGALPREPK